MNDIYQAKLSHALGFLFLSWWVIALWVFYVTRHDNAKVTELVRATTELSERTSELNTVLRNTLRENYELELEISRLKYQVNGNAKQN